MKEKSAAGFVLVEPMRSPWARTPTGDPELKAIPIGPFDFHPAGALLWLFRGPLIGLILGAAYGSWVPLLGTAVGGVLGAIVGFLLSLAVSLQVVVLRLAIRRFAVARSTADIAEQLVASLTIAGAAVIAARHMDMEVACIVYYLPALLGVAHSMLAKPPVDGAIYAGAVGGTRLWFVRALPLITLALALLAFLGLWALA